VTFDSLHVVSHYRPILTLCLKCTVFEIWQHFGRKSPKSLPHSGFAGQGASNGSGPLPFDAPCPANPRKCPHKPYVASSIDLWSTFFAADSMGLSLFISLWWAPKDIMCTVNKKLSYCWETVRRESMPRIAEMDVEMTTLAEMTFKCTSRSSKVAPIES